MIVLKAKSGLLGVPLLLLAGIIAQGALAEEGFESRFEGSVDVSYTDNLFHYSDERLDEFDLEQATNPRYEGLESTSDVVTGLKLKAGLDWKLSGKRKVSLDLAASHFLHMDNGIADYSRAAARVKYYSSKRNRWSVGAVQTIDRFKKNYLATSEFGLPEWGAASYDQTDAEFGYRRVLRHKRQFDATYRRRDRSFNPMFSDRDRTGDYIEAGVGYRTGGSWRGYSKLEVSAIDSAVGFDGPVMVDRSYDQLRLNQRFTGKVASGTHLSFDVDYRIRDFTTAVAADDARFDRTDSRLRFRAGIVTKVSKKLSLNGGVTWMDNDQDRVGVTLMADEAGYQELAADFGLSFRF